MGIFLVYNRKILSNNLLRRNSLRFYPNVG